MTVIQWLASCLQDLRHGDFLLRRDAGVSALIVLVLALGIGGNAAIFTLLKAAFLDPLPFRDAGRLITVVENNGWFPTISEFLEIRARTRTLEQLAFAEHRDMKLSGTGDPIRVFAARVTASIFPLLGVGAWRGRTFPEEENQPGRTPAVVLTHAFWRTKLGGDISIVGRTLRLDGAPALVVGVLPPGFHFDYPTLHIPEKVDIYVSYPVGNGGAIWPGSSGHGYPVRVLARLREGFTQSQAEAELRSIGQAVAQEHPVEYRNPVGGADRFTFECIPLRDAIVGTQRSLLGLLLGGAAVLLLIACTNTAQLPLARSLRRRREVAIRSALGASRLRVIQQFLLEGLVLAACGGMAGLLVSNWIAQLLVAVLPMRSPIFESAHSDGSAIGFTLTISLVSALVFAIVPAMKGSRWMPGPSLGAPVTAEGNRWRHAIIGIEAALSVFLLCGAGLVTQNLWTLISTSTGFDPKHVLAMRLTPSSRPYNAADAKADPALKEYLEKITAIPGVDSAATVTGPPLRSAGAGDVDLVGVTDGNGALKKIIGVGETHRVSPNYFRTLRIPLLAGRMFRDDDDLHAVSQRKEYVAIVNQEFARRFGLDGDVLRNQFFGEKIPITIVGIVGNVRTRGLQSAPAPEVYLSSFQIDGPNVYLIVRSEIPAAQLVKRVKAAIQPSDSDQAVFGVVTMDELISDSIAQPRFEVFLVGVFALLAVAMAAAGMYSVISCLVSQRTNEIAIRIALGAGRRDIVRTVLGATTAWVVAGLACGLGLGVATRQTIRALSSTVVEGSAWMYASVLLLFLTVTLVAAYMPMRRAIRLDPAAALRCE